MLCNYTCIFFVIIMVNNNKLEKLEAIPVLVKLWNATTSVATYAFLDDGCGAVFVDPSLCETLRSQTRKRNLLLRILNSTEVSNSAVVDGWKQVAGIQDGINYTWHKKFLGSF